MRVTLTQAKMIEMKEACQKLLTPGPCVIRSVASTIGKLVASFSGVQYGPLHYCQLEREKIAALRSHRGHFDRPMTLSNAAKTELLWWIKNVDSSYREISKGPFSCCITTDASGSGWGATNGVAQIGGRWNSLELVRAQHNETNYLEMVAVYHALRALCRTMHNTHVLVRIDNTTYCIPCDCAVTVSHILVDCREYSHIREKYYTVPDLKTLFQQTDPYLILDFLKESNLYRTF
ncbi:hypothetical protein HOLleu_43781 [Holothuria leucospilota]|uniref:Uncharacterized protein n=1 Tax=Holothuria leucospilota TaxID=206669 RepID=A0A9Q0YBJ4_HOLLE|nr:hypothetical protein HOLleu_43781 [Holothuria leucospilota]